MDTMAVADRNTLGIDMVQAGAALDQLFDQAQAHDVDVL